MDDRKPLRGPLRRSKSTSNLSAIENTDKEDRGDGRGGWDGRDGRGGWDGRDGRGGTGGVGVDKGVRSSSSALDGLKGRAERDALEARDAGDARDVRDNRDNRDNKDNKDNSSNRNSRELREIRDNRELREIRDSDRRESREAREARDTRESRSTSDIYGQVEAPRAKYVKKSNRTWKSIPESPLSSSIPVIAWLENLGLRQYENAFLSSGYDTLDRVRQSFIFLSLLLFLLFLRG